MNAYFSLLTHSKLFVLVTFFNTNAGMDLVFGHMTQADGKTDRRGS